MSKRANEFGPFHVARWVFALLPAVLYIAQATALEAAAITVEIPVDGAVFAETVPPKFVWKSRRYSQFKLQFSSDINFPKNNTFNLTSRWITRQSIRPSNAAWRQIKENESARGLIHWRILARTGPNTYVTSKAKSFSITTNAPINNRLVSVQDLASPGRGLSLSFRRFYWLDSGSSGALGPRWVHSYESHLRVYSDGAVRLWNLDGSDSYFKPRAHGGYEPMPGDYRTLSKNKNGSFNLRTKSGLTAIYGKNGKLLQFMDTNGNRVSFTYNAVGQLKRIQEASGRALVFAYSRNTSAGKLKSVTDSVGRIVSFRYDGAGRLTAVTNPVGVHTKYVYDSKGRLKQIVDGNLKSLFIAYDSANRLRSIENENGVNRQIFNYAVGPDSTKITISDALGHATRLILGQNGNYGPILEIRDPQQNTSSLAYDTSRNVTTVTAPNGSVTHFTYDKRGNVLTQTDPLGHVTRFSYEGTFNKISTLTDANGNTTVFDYDDSGNPIKTTHPDGSAESFAYDQFGNTVAFTNRRSIVIWSTFDQHGQQTASIGTLENVTISYDSAGNIKGLADKSGTIEYSYDGLDRTTQVKFPSGHTIKYQYDNVGNRTAALYPDGRGYNYGYDNAHRLVSIHGSSGAVVTYEYDSGSRRIKKVLGNGVKSAYSYDAVGNLLELVNEKSTGDLISSFRYVYDKQGNRVSVTDREGTHFYDYDPVDQLTGHTGPSTSTQYVYDALGNRTSVIENGQITPYVSNDLNQYISVGNTQFTYDADGNLAQKTSPSGTTTYQYDNAGRLAQVSTPNGAFKYGYDALGRRTSKTDANGMIRYLYDGPHIVQEIDAADQPVATYAHGSGIDEVLFMERGGNVYWYTQDGLNSVVDLTDAAQNVVETYSYDPYGEPKNTSTVGSRFMFTGREYDQESGLYYYRNRHFDPKTGRFISEDSIGFSGGKNPYTYVQNNPINYTDPSGLMRCGEKYDALGCTTGWEYGGRKWAKYDLDEDLIKFGALICRIPFDVLKEAVKVHEQKHVDLYIDRGISPDDSASELLSLFAQWNYLGNRGYSNSPCNPFPRKTPPQTTAPDPTFLQTTKKEAERQSGNADLTPNNLKLVAQLLIPRGNSLVRGNVPIFGRAYGDNFKEYRVEYGEGEKPSNWATIASSATAKTKDMAPADLDDSADVTIQGNLANWDTGLKNYVYYPSYPKDHPVDLKGIYRLRLVVTGRDGSTAEDRVTVEVGDVIPNAWGGEARSRDGRVALSIPEQALRDSFRLIAIKPVEKLPGDLPRGHELVGNAYEFREPGESFTKEATLEMDLSASGTTKPERVGIYAYNAQKKLWEHLPSEVNADGTKVRATIKTLSSHYALMVSDSPAEAAVPAKVPHEDLASQHVSFADARGHYLVRDTFEGDAGEWSNRDGDVGGEVALDRDALSGGRGSLKITNSRFGGNFAVNVRKTPFDASVYPIVQFDYRIPADVKTDFLIKVSGRWYDIGFTDDAKDLSYKRVNIANIGKVEGVVADNRWHTARFNLYEMLRTKTGNHVVEEMIMADWDVTGYMKLVFGRNREGATYYIDNFAISRETTAGLRIDEKILTVDDFNRQKETNALGGLYMIYTSPNGGRIQSVFDDEKGARGASLKLAYDVSRPDSYAGVMTSLEELDLRGFKNLNFLIKANGSQPELRVGLRDRSGQESKVRVSHYLRERDVASWQIAEIPLLAFANIKDWGAVSNLSFTFENGVGPPSGELLIDDLAFSRTLSTYLVDDFEREDRLNTLGGKHRTFVNNAAAVNGEYAFASPNKVYRISYGGNISDLFTYGGWTTDLRGIDCSECSTLSFRVRGADGGEKPNIYLDDGSHRWPVPIERYARVTPEWQEVTIPLSEYREYGVDLTHLAELQVVFEWERQSGTVFIDDIRFGPKEKAAIAVTNN